MQQVKEKPKAAKGSKASKGGRKLSRGRRTGRNARYHASGRREKRKLKHCIKSNGIPFAKKYATEHGLLTQLNKLMAGTA